MFTSFQDLSALTDVTVLRSRSILKRIRDGTALYSRRSSSERSAFVLSLWKKPPQTSGVSSQLAGTAIHSPEGQALRQAAMAAIESAVTKHQRLEQQKGWLMKIDSQTQKNVKALRSQVKQLQSDADFS